MTPEEHEQATSALIAWFESQGILPADAAFIMIKLMAQQLTAKSQDVISLQKAILLNNNILVLEVAGYLKP